jgi:hypothetical protein
MVGARLQSKRLLAEWMFWTFLFGYLQLLVPISISAAAKGSRQRIPMGEGRSITKVSYAGSLGFP